MDYAVCRSYTVITKEKQVNSDFVIELISSHHLRFNLLKIGNHIPPHLDLFRRQRTSLKGVLPQPVIPSLLLCIFLLLCGDSALNSLLSGAFKGPCQHGYFRAVFSVLFLLISFWRVIFVLLSKSSLLLSFIAIFRKTVTKKIIRLLLFCFTTIFSIIIYIKLLLIVLAQAFIIASS